MQATNRTTRRTTASTADRVALALMIYTCGGGRQRGTRSRNAIKRPTHSQWPALTWCVPNVHGCAARFTTPLPAEAVTQRALAVDAAAVRPAGGHQVRQERVEERRG